MEGTDEMAGNGQNQNVLKKAGYAALIDRYELDVIPNWHTSWVATRGMRRVTSREDSVEEIYPFRYWPGDTLGDHLEFALKYDGTNLGILAALFQRIEEKNLLDYIRTRPTGKYARRLWFLYEFLTGKTLPLKDLDRGNYVDLLDPERYYTVAEPRRVRRQRINNNLLGDSRFCPAVRRTDTLKGFEQADLPGRCRKVVSGYPLELLKRAIDYLYTKENFELFLKAIDSQKAAINKARSQLAFSDILTLFFLNGSTFKRIWAQTFITSLLRLLKKLHLLNLEQREVLISHPGIYPNVPLVGRPGIRLPYVTYMGLHYQVWPEKIVFTFMPGLNWQIPNEKISQLLETNLVKIKKLIEQNVD